MLLKHARVAVLSVYCMTLFACDDDDEYVEAASNSTADFTAYKTFAISTAGGTVAVPASVATNLGVVNDAIQTQLQDLGLTEVDLSQSPDLIAFSLASTEETAAFSWNCVPGYWYGYWDWSYTPCGWIDPIYDEYTVGTVVIGLTDPAIEQVVFGGVMQEVLDGQSTDEITDDINDGVENVFDEYPSNQTGEK
jgi:hypothetical protein